MERGDVIEEERSQEENQEEKDQEQEFAQHGIYNGLKRKFSSFDSEADGFTSNKGHVSPQVFYFIFSFFFIFDFLLLLYL